MALNASITSAVSQTTIASAAYNANISNLNGAENPTFTQVKQTAGTQETGNIGAELHVVSTIAQVALYWNFRSVMTNTPTSITLSAQYTTQATDIAAATITTNGFELSWKGTVANALTQVFEIYTTVGN